MGCLYACTCSGMCTRCNSYQPEQYIGHAEDLLAQANGFRDAAEWENASNKQQKEIEDYEKWLHDEYKKSQNKETSK